MSRPDRPRRARGPLLGALAAAGLIACAARGAEPPPRLSLDAAALADYLRPAAGERAVVANFWATWCGPCVAEMPHLVELARRHAPDGVRVVAVSIDLPLPFEAQTAAEVHAFADARGFDLPVVALTDGWDDVLERYELSGPVPATIVLDRSGAVLERHEGAADLERFEAMLRGALAGAAAPPDRGGS